MRPELISKNELIALGWKNRQVDAALDEADEIGPSGHWLNTHGKPYYYRDRVAMAAHNIGLSNERPSDDQFAKWEKSEKPTSLPELTFDFHRLADVCIKGASREFWSLRLSHPVMGRRGGTRDKELQLLENVLLRLVELTFEVKLKNCEELYHYLTLRSKSAEFLGSQRLVNVVVRPAVRSSYVSKATGLKYLKKCVDAIALIHTGLLLNARGNQINLIEQLITSPSLRFDRIVRSCAQV